MPLNMALETANAPQGEIFVPGGKHHRIAGCQYPHKRVQRNSECVGIDDFLVVIYGSVYSAEVSNACRSRPAHVTQFPQLLCNFFKIPQYIKVTLMDNA